MTTSAIPSAAVPARHARPIRGRAVRDGMLRGADRVLDGLSSDAPLLDKSLSLLALSACWLSFVAAGLALLARG